MPDFFLILAGCVRHDPVSQNINDAALGRDGGTVDATDLKSVGANAPCGFESRSRYKTRPASLIGSGLFS